MKQKRTTSKQIITHCKAPEFNPHYVLPSYETPSGELKVYYLKNHIKYRRDICRISQYTLAYHLNISRQSVNQIERGLVVPSLIIAFKMADYFKITIEELFESDWQYFDDE